MIMKQCSCFSNQKDIPTLCFLLILFWKKILKANVVKNTKKQAPRSHDLARLQELAKIEISKEEKDLLYATNEFNIRARYPDYKLNFYKYATRDYAKNHIEKTKKLYTKLCQELKPKK